MALFNAVPFAFYVESYRAMQQQFAPSFQQILDKIHSQLNSYSGDLLAHENAHLSPKNVKDKKSVLRIAAACLQSIYPKLQSSRRKWRCYKSQLSLFFNLNNGAACASWHQP